MPFSPRLRCLLIALCAGFWIAWASGQAVAACPFHKPFTYFAASQNLGAVLSSFARTQGYAASISPSVDGTISGRFDRVAPSKFLGGMEQAFGVGWYTVGRTLHFYNLAESTRIVITPKMIGATEMHGLLAASPVVSPELRPQLSSDRKTLACSGPREYLDQIAEAARSYENSQAGQPVMKVFPLKYAWADDISISSMDKTVTVPGIAAILRAMVTGKSVTGTLVTREKAKSESLRGQGLGAETAVSGDAAREERASDTAARPSGVNVMADTRMNAVIVSDAAYRMPFYAQVIADLDKPVELVEIHAAIVDIDTNCTRSLGVNYQGSYRPSGNGWGGGGDISSAPGSMSLPSEGSLLSGAGLNLATIYKHGADFFMARIQALESTGDAKVLGRPSVLTVDNVQATLENTTTYYIPVQGERASDLFKVETGTVLRVTPHIIHENGRTSIKLAVNVQDDQKDAGGGLTSSASGQQTVNPIKQTKINTQAIIGAEQSLLIGGYSYESKSDTDSGIPVLKSIPILGHLFKSSTKANKRMERLILLTPRIIRLDSLPSIPGRVQEPSFLLAPDRPDYEPQPHMPEQPRSGCSRRVSVAPQRPE